MTSKFIVPEMQKGQQQQQQHEYTGIACMGGPSTQGDMIYRL